MHDGCRCYNQLNNHVLERTSNPKSGFYFIYLFIFSFTVNSLCAYQYYFLEMNNYNKHRLKLEPNAHVTETDLDLGISGEPVFKGVFHLSEVAGKMAVSS